MYCIVDMFPTLFRPFRGALEKTLNVITAPILDSQDQKSAGALMKVLSLLENTAKVDKNSQANPVFLFDILVQIISNLTNSLLVCVDEG